MRLIIGGSYQGKYQYAKETYPDAVILNGLHALIREDVRQRVCGENVSGASAGPDSAMRRTGYVDLQQKLEESWYQRLEGWIADNPDLCIVCDEVGMGIVPLERWERIYREVVGHMCIRLAREAESVERIVCGCSQKLKG